MRTPRGRGESEDTSIGGEVTETYLSDLLVSPETESSEMLII